MRRQMLTDPDADAADEDVDVDVEVEDEVDDLDVDGRVAVSDLSVDVEDAAADLDVYVEVAVLDLDVDVEVAVLVDERVQDDNGKDEVETVVGEVDADNEVLVYDVAIVVRKLVVQQWLLPIQDEDVGLWVVEPNDDKMRKHNDMMQGDVVHSCQVEKEVAILEVEEEVCIAQLSVEEEEGSDAVEASDAASLLPLVEACCHRGVADDSPR